MASFTIAKRITQTQLKKMVKQLNIDENSQEFKTHLNNQIIRDTQLAVYNNKIPGWITNEKLPRKVIPKDPTPNKPANKSKKKSALSEDKKAKLTLFATIIVRKILEQKSTTEEKCFLIHRIVSGLGLRDSDFKQFQNNNLMDGDDDDDDDFDEDDHDHDDDDDNEY